MTRVRKQNFPSSAAAKKWLLWKYLTSVCGKIKFSVFLLLSISLSLSLYLYLSIYLFLPYLCLFACYGLSRNNQQGDLMSLWKIAQNVAKAY
jgi:hypothetical protein